MSSKKTIFKNTSLLYVRQLFTLALSLYTSRLTLQVLGASDFGIYAAVGGFTALLNILTSSMAGSGQRFLTFELGQGNKERLIAIFNTFFQLMLGLSLLLVLLAETLGVWFLNSYLTIPAERHDVAFWVFQFSIFACVLNIINAPYSAVVVAHEDMGKFALFSIADAVLKLAFVALLFVVRWDKLLTYAFLLLLIQVIDRIIMWVYCRRYEEAHFRWGIDRGFIRQMSGFAGWTLLSNLSIIGFAQGVNVLLNICFGPLVNAAFTVANQAYSGIRSFCSSFQLACNPQIVKTYSQQQLDELNQLLLFVCKMSFFLVFLLSLPFLVNADYIMRLWLVDVPQHAVGFFTVLLVYAYLDVFAYPLDTAAQATGRLKTYTLRTSLLLLTILPLGYVGYRYCGLVPEGIYAVAIAIGFVGIMVRLVTLRQTVHLRVRSFVVVLLRCIAIAVCSFLIAYAAKRYMADTLPMVALSFILCITESLFFIAVFGMNRAERSKIVGLVRNKIFKK